MPGHPSIGGDGGQIAPQIKFYTGKTINATKGSRTADTTTPLLVGEVLVQDPYGHDKGKDQDVAIPTTGFLAGNCYLVVDVPPGSRFGGPVSVVPYQANAQVYIASTSALVAGTTHLGPVNGKRCLAIVTSVASLDAIKNAVALANEAIGSVPATIASYGGNQGLANVQFYGNRM